MAKQKGPPWERRPLEFVFDGDKSISGEQVVLATFIDDAKIAVAFRRLVGNHDIDLVALEGGLVACIANAHRESDVPTPPVSPRRGTSSA